MSDISQDLQDSEEELIEPTRKRSKGKLIIIVVLLTLLAIWLVPGDEEPLEPIAKPESPPLTSDSDATPAEPSAEPVKPQMAGSAARDLIRELDPANPDDLNRAFIAAQQHNQNGELEDAYLLYFYAARAGHGKAAFTLAQHADPTHFKPGGLYPQADAGQAYKWYQKAAELGEPEATPALNALRSTVETAAANGDSHAQRVILLWK